MNMISDLRHRFTTSSTGTVVVNADEFNQLQREWVTRTGAEDMVAAEREKHADIADEYDRLIRHMDSGGDFHEFMAAESKRRFGE